METNLAANAPEQTTAAPEKSESAPETPESPASVEKVESQNEPEWFKKRFDEITAHRRNEERRAIAAEARAYQLEQQLAQLNQQRQPPAQEEKPKTLADFDYDESKYHAYVLDQAEKRAERAARRVREEEQQRTNAERRDQKFRERAAEFEKSDPEGWQAAITAPFSDRLVDAIKDAESGPELAAYLAKNPDIARQLENLPDRAMTLQLGRYEEKLSREKADKSAALEAAKAAKAVTKAPDPPATIEGSGEPGNVSPDEADSDKLSDTEWLRRREKQVKRRQTR